MSDTTAGAGMMPAGSAPGALSLRIGDSLISLPPPDAELLSDALETACRALKRRLPQLERDQPQSLEASVRSIGALTQVAEKLARARARLGEAPVELDPAEAALVDEALAQLRRRQRYQLTSALSELKRALYRL